MSADLPVLIIGAGPAGFLLAQTLRRHHIPYRIFDRAPDPSSSSLSTNRLGWGLTLHWSLPTLHNLLPKELVERLPEAYSDRRTVESGEATAFPFYDLSTAELKGVTPKLKESERIRVSRARLSDILGTGVNVEWGKVFSSVSQLEDGEGVTVSFEDETRVRGWLVVGCDGSRSRVRRALFPVPERSENTAIPVRLYGFTMRKSVEEASVMRVIDPFVVTGTASRNGSFMFLSVLDGQGENALWPRDYVYAVCISRLLTVKEQEERARRTGTGGKEATPEEKRTAVQEVVKDWADPFRTFILSSLPPGSSIKQLNLDDYRPPNPLPPTALASRATLMGDALHTMTMYRGEGANHVIIDVQDFEDIVIPVLKADLISNSHEKEISSALRKYEMKVISRTQPAVLASRQACLDAHDWSRLMDTSLGPSPLLTKREMFAQVSL